MSHDDSPIALMEDAEVELITSTSDLHAARLRGLGVAVPALCWPQERIAGAMTALWNLRGGDLDRWRRIIAASEIEKRHAVLPIEQVVGLTTSQRMQAYEQFAPALAEQAARQALNNSGVSEQQITDLIVVSCTGFSAPGVDAALVSRLGLQPNVRRTVVGFMGCFGAISGLRTAVGACAANRNAITLVVCVELCSLHMRGASDPQNQVASALFADGAAAAVVASTARKTASDDGTSGMEIGRLTTGASLLIQEGRDWMTWRITDAGFAMTLAREVPIALRQRLAAFVAGACPQRPCTFIVHPGGPGILNAADQALQLQGQMGLQFSRAILRRFGNVSSATVLFVLQEALRHGCQLPALLLAFGPGLTIESLALLPG